MRDRLPVKIYHRLAEIGRLADQSGVAAFAVGGLVRDLLLGRGNLVVDIAVEGDGMAFARRLADRYGAGLKIFERFATALVVYPDRMKLDIANTRAEPSPGAFAHTTGAWRIPAGGYCSIEQDLMRRDFTFNALAIHLNSGRFGRLLDPSGGLRDLRAHTLRAVYEFCFVDDPARVFRAIRFSQRFGCRIEAWTLGLLKDAMATGLVHKLPFHRVKSEVFLLLAEGDPGRMIRRMADFDILRVIHPALTLDPRLETLLANLAKALDWWQRRFPHRKIDRPLVYFMALLDGLNRPAMNSLLKRLVLPKRQAITVRSAKSRLGAALRRVSRSRPLKASEIYRVLAGLPDESLVLLLGKALSIDMKRLVLAYVDSYRPINLSINGKTLATMGLRQGPAYKKVLDNVMNAKLNGRIKSEREEQAFAQRLVKKMAG